ncbi:MAG: addiction module antitoxin RelB [Nevskiaceae bacterium]|nr:MAG: addiction module antitoxin RelB [Nevskiaceae bacterium]TBR72784.1 MAG: addiction module antitoxin RelB [Nevskiaceae bacterium]
MNANPSAQTLQEAALQLQPAARMQLAHTLIKSLSALPEAELSPVWLAEAERRDAEMEDGSVTGIPGEMVFRQLHARHHKP